MKYAATVNLLYTFELTFLQLKRSKPETKQMTNQNAQLTKQMTNSTSSLTPCVTCVAAGSVINHNNNHNNHKATREMSKQQTINYVKNKQTGHFI